VAQRELRDLTRYRSTFIQERVTLINRVQHPKVRGATDAISLVH
jgi:hypothetical protein